MFFFYKDKPKPSPDVENVSKPPSDDTRDPETTPDSANYSEPSPNSTDVDSEPLLDDKKDPEPLEGIKVLDDEILFIIIFRNYIHLPI